MRQICFNKAPKGKKIKKERNNKLGEKEGKKEKKGRMEGGEEGRQAKILTNYQILRWVLRRDI